MKKREWKDVIVGGQAVIEGVMMKNGDRVAIAVRTPEKDISMKTLKAKSYFGKLSKIPFVRGVTMLIDTLVLGIGALTFSASESLGEKEEKVSSFSMFLTMLFSFVMAIGIFIILPLWLTKFFTSDHGFVFNAIDGGLRILIFLLYILGISLMPDIKRVFQYHGAEHKSVACYEAGDELTVKNARKHSRLHPRCGTTFIFLVLVVSIILFSLIVSSSWLVKFGVRILFIPLVASISYEILRFAGKHFDNPIMKVIIAPGLASQLITTKEPDDKQLEVALKALKAVV